MQITVNSAIDLKAIPDVWTDVVDGIVEDDGRLYILSELLEETPEGTKTMTFRKERPDLGPDASETSVFVLNAVYAAGCWSSVEFL